MIKQQKRSLTNMGSFDMLGSEEGIKIVIMNYNLGNHADLIYQKLITDGFQERQIILIDNGSEKSKPAQNTNMMLPWNVRVSGQMKISMDYLLDYYPSDFYLYVTTSANLLSSVNYKQATKETLKDCYSKLNNIAMIASSITGGNIDKFPTQNYNLLSKDYAVVGLVQPMMILYSDKFLRMCRDNKIGCYNKDLIRGHGMDTEMRYFAHHNGMDCIVAKKMHIEWLVNNTHAQGMADESQKEYKEKARKEAFSCFSSRYGKDWQTKILSEINYRKIIEYIPK